MSYAGKGGQSSNIDDYLRSLTHLSASSRR